MNWLLELIGFIPSRTIRNNSTDHMPVSGNSSEEQANGFDSEAKLSFAETIEHLNRGFEHTQRVAQFMDAKASGVIAFCIAVFAFIANVVAWVYGVSGSGCLTKWDEPCSWVRGILAVLVVWTTFQGGMCLYRAFSAIRPNGLPSRERFTTLFPVMEKASKQKDAVDYLDRLVAGESRKFVLREFNNQLLDMGGIIYFKIAEVQEVDHPLALAGRPRRGHRSGSWSIGGLRIDRQSRERE